MASFPPAEPSSESSQDTRRKPVSLNCHFADCGKTFRQWSDLKNHIRTHTGEKPYTCPYENCGKHFATNSQLRRHERTHTQCKPCVCTNPTCGKGFRTSSHLKRHQKIHLREAREGERRTDRSPMFDSAVPHTPVVPPRADYASLQSVPMPVVLPNPVPVFNPLVMPLLPRYYVDPMEQPGPIVHVLPTPPSHLLFRPTASLA